MAIHLGRPLPNASRDLPGRRRGNPPAGPQLLGVLRAAPIWSCSRWGLPCHLRCRRRGALLPHPFTLAAGRSPVGGLLSVALSLGLPPPAVNRHRVSVEPGLSSPRGFPRCERRPSDRLAGLKLAPSARTSRDRRQVRRLTHRDREAPSVAPPFPHRRARQGFRGGNGAERRQGPAPGRYCRIRRPRA